MFKFRQWPFSKEEIIKLLWIKSPYKDKNNEWILPVLFLDKGNAVVEIKTAWATLPFLRFSQFYFNDTPTDRYHEGSIVMLDIEDVSKGTICDSSILPEELFKFKDHIREEKIWRFETQGKIIFIPCIELVRAFYASNSTLAKALLEQNGLDFLIPYSKSFGERVALKLDHRVPRKLINDDFVQHLVWVKFDKLANKIWNSILFNILPKGDIEPPLLLFPEILPKKELESAKKIQMIPPMKGSSTWEVRALSKDHNLLILDLMGVSNLVPPYSKVIYSHQTLTKRKSVTSNQSNLKRKMRRNNTRSTNAQKLIVRESPTGKANVSIVKVKPTMMRFDSKTSLEKEHNLVEVPTSLELKLHKHRQLSKKEKREMEIKAHQEKLKRELEQRKALFSSAESTFLGNSDVSPIEINGSKISDTSYEDGLGQFREMVNILGQRENRLTIFPLEVSSLPGTRSFAYKEDGTSRRYAIVEIEFDRRSYYLLEIERLSKLYLATLIIQHAQDFGLIKRN